MEPAEKLSDMAKLWLMHPDGEYFLSKGGHTMPPPLSCNLGLTTRCNLRCLICGSQRGWDLEKVHRRSMERETFLQVAQTLFPLMTEVELNSHGEPLLYPHIEEVLTAISDYGCKVKLQSNGTMLTPRIIDLLSYQCGTLSLSIDAVGKLFNQVRVGADWKKVEQGVRNLMNHRHPELLKVILYPTVTKRTLPQMLPLVQWAATAGLDGVFFHRYDPNPYCTEERPTREEFAVQKELLLNWHEQHPGGPCVYIGGAQIGDSVYPTATCLAHRPSSPWPNYPLFPGQAGCHPEYLCPTPSQYVEIGLDGDISACCRSQQSKLGYATSVEQFAAAWLGYEYRAIRKSLWHCSRFSRPLKECEPCIANYWEMIAGPGRPVGQLAVES